MLLCAVILVQMKGGEKTWDSIDSDRGLQAKCSVGDQSDTLIISSPFIDDNFINDFIVNLECHSSSTYINSAEAQPKVSEG